DIEKRKQMPNNREKSPTKIDHNDINYNDIDNDDYEINESLDPINKTKSDSKFLSVQKYPDELSPPDFWKLPS
ncbi:2898_t:CDS:1, partial [Funneliformis mosseae]